jgi:chorismate synthase
VNLLLRYLTAGETHGKALTAIIDGVPSNLKVDIDLINSKLRLRQSGYGRGDRMKIESDEVEILSGVRDGKTLGSPITIQIKNRDWQNWEKEMNSLNCTYERRVTKPRPGHADLSGAIKYNHRDIRNVLERASARETAIRTAAGFLCAGFLNQFGITSFSHVKQVGDAVTQKSYLDYQNKNIGEILDKTNLRCLDENAEEKMKEAIRICKENGDSVGGKFEVVVNGAPIGLGSYAQWDSKLDGKLAQALVSIQAIKAVEFGAGNKYASTTGSQIHDPIEYDGNSGFCRRTNNAGGIEGGMTNGEDIVIDVVMKPIPTLYKPIDSVEIDTKEKYKASIERSDVCAVTAASVVGEAITMFEICKAFFDKFSGDNFEEINENLEWYKDYCKQF